MHAYRAHRDDHRHQHVDDVVEDLVPTLIILVVSGECWSAHALASYQPVAALQEYSRCSSM